MNIIGSVEGKTCILTDDMIDWYNSVMRRMPLPVLEGAVEACGRTHPVYQAPAMTIFKNNPAIKKPVWDTIYLSEDRLIDKIEQISDW